MPYQSLDDDIALSTSFEILITAYQKISVSRMQRIRQHVLAARTFTEELTKVYYEVRAGQRQFQEGFKQFNFLKSKKKTYTPVAKPLLVILSSNNRLDGGISQIVFRQFAKYFKQHPHSDIIVTGEVGKSLFKESFPDTPYSYIQLPNPPIASADLAPLVTATSNHTDVRIYYGKFISFINQEPAVAKLADIQAEQTNKSTKISVSSYIYEPTMQTVVAYFDTQILTALMSRTSQEASLAEYGSRVTAMEEARQRIDNMLEQLQQEARQQKRDIQNKHQREQLASIALWKT